MSVDRLVLLGLNEGTWPASLDTGPWLSRPMRRGLGLNPPEVRIGLAAHAAINSVNSSRKLRGRKGLCDIVVRACH